MKVERLREDFPLLSSQQTGQKIIYFDNACMSLRPMQVIDALNSYYKEFPACAGRSNHRLASILTKKVDESRKSLQKFFNAKKSEEIAFTKNTTEALNLVANSLGIKKGDMILTTDKEHNSNLLPWQEAVRTKGAVHKVIMSNQDNTFNLDNFEKMMNDKVKLVSVVQTSNLDGVTNPVKEITKIAHKFGALVIVDAAQSAPKGEMNVRKLDIDFLACSGHKMLGPSGIGALYGKYELLDKLSPFIIGGETVSDSTYHTCQLEKPPERFEAGLQHYAGILGFGEAARYLMKLGRKNILKHLLKLNNIISEELLPLDKIELIGPKDPAQRGGIFSLNIKGTDPHMVSVILDTTHNIMTRSGAHCCHSWFNNKNLHGSLRPSLYFYNTEKECETFINAIKSIISTTG